jgi:hypothetical protein
MGITKQITIVRQIHNKQVQGYKGYNIYCAREAIALPYGMSSNGDFYLMTTDNYAAGHNIWIDLEKETEPLENNKTGKIDGYNVYVKIPPPVIPEGHFRVKQMVPATAPFESFRKRVLARSQYNLYETTHIKPDGTTGSLSRVFSEVTFFRGEDIPGQETLQLRKLKQQDKFDYYVHDKAMFTARATANLRRSKG